MVFQAPNELPKKFATKYKIMSNSVHQLEEPKACNNCGGDGHESQMICTVCDGEGTWPKGWYFWCEASVNRFGPYKSEEEANTNLKEYARRL